MKRSRVSVDVTCTEAASGIALESTSLLKRPRVYVLSLPISTLIFRNHGLRQCRASACNRWRQLRS